MGEPDEAHRLEELVRIAMARPGPQGAVGATGPSTVANAFNANTAILVTPGMSPYQAAANTNLLLFLASGPIVVKMPLGAADGNWLRAKDKQGQSPVNPATFLVSTPVQIEDPNNPGNFLSSIAFMAQQGGEVDYAFTASIQEWVLWGD
jgi:hypothetical protein